MLCAGLQASMHLLNDMINQAGRIARFANVTLTLGIEYGARR